MNKLIGIIGLIISCTLTYSQSNDTLTGNYMHIITRVSDCYIGGGLQVGNNDRDTTIANGLIIGNAGIIVNQLNANLTIDGINNQTSFGITGVGGFSSNEFQTSASYVDAIGGHTVVMTLDNTGMSITNADNNSSYPFVNVGLTSTEIGYWNDFTQNRTAFVIEDTVSYILEGNVGIGTNTPDEKLEVIGNIKCDTLKVTTPLTEIYSLFETAVGFWHNGDTLFRKVIEFSNLAQDGDIVHNLNINNYVRVDIFETSPESFRIGDGLWGLSSGGYEHLLPNSIDVINDGVHDPVVSGYVILEYTKN